MNKYLFKLKVALITMFAVILSFGFMERDKKDGSATSAKPEKLSKTAASGFVGNSYRLNVNNLNLPLNSRGVIADVNIPPDGTLGKFNNIPFLFSSGFYVSGYANGELFANAQATASLIENYLPGTVDGRDGGMWVLNAEDEPFGQSWQDWKGAVELGADFYDGNGDGVYNPVDLNGNGIWDPEEDSPDILGSETVWTVYNDGVPVAQRDRFPGVGPMGIEIKQTVFAFASKGALGNIAFIRYRLKNTGLVADTLKDVFFSVFADPDIGDATDDLVGSDIARNAGYTYNDGPDEEIDGVPPAYLIDFFSGPVSYIPGETFTDVNGNNVYDPGVDAALDTAYSLKGQLIGIETYPGAKNLGLYSFMHYIQTNPIHGDPETKEQARNYMLGLDREGVPIDPCSWSYGEVRGNVACTSVDPLFLYSGDPVAQTGWIETEVTDQRQISNTGPFAMAEGEEIEIVVAYVVGQGNTAVNSVEVAKSIDDGAQFIFDQNFRSPTPPPSVDLKVETGDGFIDLIWETPEQVQYMNQTVAWDLRFEGFNIYAFRTSSPAEDISGTQNQLLLQNYDLDNFVEDVYKENAETGGIEPLYDKSELQLSYQTYIQPETGKIRYRLRSDPFTGGDLIKGKPYYFAVTSYALNYDALISMDDAPFGETGDYYLSAAAFTGESENVLKVTKVVMGEDLYNPAMDIVPLAGPETHVSGASGGNVDYDIVNKQELTGEQYEVTFEIDSSTADYSTFWKLQNNTTGNILVDSSKEFLYQNESIAVPITDGFILRVADELPLLGKLQYDAGMNWVGDTSLFYLATDLGDQSRRINTLPGLGTKSNQYIKADKLRRVEIRFDQPGKAYRYINGYVGSFIGRRNNFIYAEGVTESNPAFAGDINEIGKVGEGFVDVPFTAWVDDQEFGETRQLAVGFLELKSGNPDGVWDPGTELPNSQEYIVIFYSDYDPEGNQQVYKGYQGDGEMEWANLLGYEIPENANADSETRNIANSPYFNTLYAVGVEKAEENSTVSGKMIIPIDNYPYTPADVYRFETTAGGKLADASEKEIFEKVNVFPNPMLGYNPATSYDPNASPDEPFVTFSNLPTEITIKIYSLSGQLLRTLTTEDKGSPTSPFLQWDLKNESGLRVASGMYLAIVNSPKYGEKILKFGIVLPQKQLPKF